MFQRHRKWEWSETDPKNFPRAGARLLTAPLGGVRARQETPKTFSGPAPGGRNGCDHGRNRCHSGRRRWIGSPTCERRPWVPQMSAWSMFQFVWKVGCEFGRKKCRVEEDQVFQRDLACAAIRPSGDQRAVAIDQAVISANPIHVNDGQAVRFRQRAQHPGPCKARLPIVYGELKY